MKRGLQNNPETPLSVAKELYLKQNTGKGEALNRITPLSQLKSGDLVTVRLVITAKEDISTRSPQRHAFSTTSEKVLMYWSMTFA